jgi:hypothetical protein
MEALLLARCGVAAAVAFTTEEAGVEVPVVEAGEAERMGETHRVEGTAAGTAAGASSGDRGPFG